MINMATTPPTNPGDPNAFTQGNQEAHEAAGTSPAPEVTIVPAPQPSQPGAPTPAEPPSGPNGERYFTSDDIERVRREEKEKLYDRIEELNGKISELSEAEQQRLAEIQEAKAAEEEARRKAAEEEMSAKELIQAREDEWRKQQEELTGAVTTLQQQLEERDAILDRERQFQEAQQYRSMRVQQEVEAGSLMPHLQNMVAGHTPEEVEQSIAQLQQTSAAIMQDMAAATQAPQQQPGPRVTMPPVGPMDTQSAHRTITPEDIQNMPMSEYAQNRDALLASAKQQVRDRGLYDR